MKKYLLFMLAFLPMTLFTACSSSDDDENQISEIIGTWNLDNATGYTQSLTFAPDGTVLEYTTLEGTNAKMEEKGTYSVNKDKLTITWKESRYYNFLSDKWTNFEPLEKGAETVVITFTINGNKLTFVSMDGEKENKPITYTRK